jgi:fumarate hydratase class II
MPEQRIESDSLGPVEVPADRYWGAQTERARRNFPIGGERLPPELVHALARVKAAAARANRDLGLLDPVRADLILAAAAEVESGALDDHFPLPVWQTGSGTSSHMNVNEVIANRANELAGAPLGGKEPVHPNDHVNLGQSSNDVFPTAIHVAVVGEWRRRLLPVLGRLVETLGERSRRFADVVKIGRTHLMDAVPLTLGQEMSGWARQVEAGIERLHATLPRLCELALGGTAVGTGVNAHPELAARAIAHLAASTGEPWRPARNRFEAIAAHDALVEAHGALRTLACSLIKIGNDVRWLGSGPRSGLGELKLPANEPGSSILPGKVNPTQAEALLMVSAQVLGNDVAVGIAGASGNLELNVAKPLLADNLLRSSRLLGDAAASFHDRCLAGLEPDRARIGELVGRSLMLVTALAPLLGHDAAAAIARKAEAEGLSLRQATLDLGLVDADTFDRLVRPERMTGPTGDGHDPAR